MFTRIRKSVLAATAVGVVTATLALVAIATPASAYGKANWQLTFAATGTFPSTGNGTGFWGWCDLGGGVTSGTTGDCQITQYVHSAAGSGFTCHESLDLTAWTGTGGTFLITGTGKVTPVSLTDACLGIFPGSSPFTDVNSGIPSTPGHFNFGVGAIFPGAVGEFNATVTQVP